MNKIEGINEDLIRLVMAQIEDTPEHWDQTEWCRSEDVCKTTLCFAGWVAFMTDMVDGWGKPTAAGRQFARTIPWFGREDDFPFEEYATQALGLDDLVEATDALFSTEADGEWFHDAPLSVGQRIRNMKQTIYRATGVDIP